MSRWESKDSNWYIELPNTPTLIAKILIICLSILVLKSAITNQSIALGVLALIISHTELKFGYRNRN